MWTYVHIYAHRGLLGSLLANSKCLQRIGINAARADKGLAAQYIDTIGTEPAERAQHIGSFSNLCK